MKLQYTTVKTFQITPVDSKRFQGHREAIFHRVLVSRGYGELSFWLFDVTISDFENIFKFSDT